MKWLGNYLSQILDPTVGDVNEFKTVDYWFNKLGNKKEDEPADHLDHEPISIFTTTTTGIVFVEAQRYRPMNYNNLERILQTGCKTTYRFRFKKP